MLTPMVRYIASVLLLAILAMPADASASSRNYEKRLSDREAKVQLKHKEFRLVRSIETFPERLNATIKRNMVSSPSGAIVTLHDGVTGEPLESCRTPCTLHQEFGRRYLFVGFKEEHFPQIRKEIADFREMIMEKYGTTTEQLDTVVNIGIQLIQVTPLNPKRNRRIVHV